MSGSKSRLIALNMNAWWRCEMKYPELKWVVLCMWKNSSYWEAIAAFNCESAAVAYKEDCENVNAGWLTYKIEEIVNESR